MWLIELLELGILNHVLNETTTGKERRPNHREGETTAMYIFGVGET